MQILVYFCPFRSKNLKIGIWLDSFSKQIHNIWVIFRPISVFETTALLNLPTYSILLPDLIWSLIRLLLLKPRYDPSSAFLMNIFFALKDLNFFIILRAVKTFKGKRVSQTDSNK